MAAIYRFCTALLALVTVTEGIGAAQARSSAQPTAFNHVFVIVMENTAYSAIVGNSYAPWINGAVAKYRVAQNYYGVTHPSQPNYISATAGTPDGVSNDSNYTLNVPNIVDQLEKAGKTWTAYMQSLSLCKGNLLAATCGNLYARKHDPFVSYSDVQSSKPRLAHIVDFGKLSTDLSGNTVSDFTWITPDLCHDMHGQSKPKTDPCSTKNPNSLTSMGDAFLKATVNAIIASPAWTGNSVIFITWDEAEGKNNATGCCEANPGGGHVLTLVISKTQTAAASSAVPYNHYSLLATIEDGWHLGCLAITCDTTHVKPMTDLTG